MNLLSRFSHYSSSLKGKCLKAGLRGSCIWALPPFLRAPLPAVAPGLALVSVHSAFNLRGFVAASAPLPRDPEREIRSDEVTHAGDDALAHYPIEAILEDKFGDD